MPDYKKSYYTAQTTQADRTKPFILYMDSMNSASESLMQPLRSYIEMEFLEKKMAGNKEFKDYFTD